MSGGNMPNESAGIPEDMIEQAVGQMIDGKLLEVWIGIRDQQTGGLVYTYLAASNVTKGQTVNIKHKVGDFRVE